MDKARLLYACSNSNHEASVMPSFANQHSGKYLALIELDNLDYAFERYSVILSNYVLEQHKYICSFINVLLDLSCAISKSWL